MICRMCLGESLEGLNIFGHNRTQFQFVVAAIIAQHFWFQPTKDDSISNMICYSCWWKIEDFHIYYLSVKEAQRKHVEILPAKEESSFRTVHLQVETAYLDEDFDRTENEEITEEMEEIYVSELSSDEGFPTSADPINANYPVSSDDEVVADQKSTDCQALKSEYVTAFESTNLNNNSKQSNEIVVVDLVSNESTEKVIQKDKSCKAKSKTVKESVNKKKKKKSDEEIAEGTKLKCDLCNSEFAVFAELKRHYRNIHGEHVTCCSIKFRKRCEFLDHLHHHINPECFRCNDCDKVYANRRSLHKHNMLHHREPKPHTESSQIFQCEQCSRLFKKSYLLTQHKRNVHVPRDPNTYYSCEKCGKCFKRKLAMQIHYRRVHENAYTQMCHICAKVIRSRTVFVKHQLEHAGISEPEQQCQECGVRVKNIARLKVHMKIHTEMNDDHICNICGKSLISKAALRSHIRYAHFAKWEHPCNLCDKVYREQHLLKEHIANHTGDILYTCPYCPKTFNSKSNLHKHRKRMHPKEWEENRKYPGRPIKLLFNSEEDDSKADSSQMKL